MDVGPSRDADVDDGQAEVEGHMNWRWRWTLRMALLIPTSRSPVVTQARIERQLRRTISSRGGGRWTSWWEIWSAVWRATGLTVRRRGPEYLGYPACREVDLEKDIDSRGGEQGQLSDMSLGTQKDGMAFSSGTKKRKREMG